MEDEGSDGNGQLVHVHVLSTEPKHDSKGLGVRPSLAGRTRAAAVRPDENQQRYKVDNGGIYDG